MESPLSRPDLSGAKTILAVQPHYDDNDIPAGGTLAALAGNGAVLYYLTVTDDLVGVVDQSLSDEEMAARLKDDQRRAGEIIGVAGHYWLGNPDAGQYDYFAVRRDIIKHIRMLRPDFLFTCDPWLPYEAHHDHILAGRAAAEAAILYNFTRIQTDPQIDAQFEPYDLTGVVFYGTAHANTIFDITPTREKKHRAIDSYRAQFTVEDMQMLHLFLDFKERGCAAGESFSHGEPLKVLRPLYLHGMPDAWKA